MDVTKDSLDEVTRFQRLELDRRERIFRGNRPAPDLSGRTVLLVDDGVASGESARNAIAVVRSQTPRRIVLAVPVVQDSVAGDLRHMVDDLACVRRPADLFAIRAWFDHFPEVSDWEVGRIIERAMAERGAASHGASRADYGIQ
jgi:putative phosphoribosyl transferase